MSQTVLYTTLIFFAGIAICLFGGAFIGWLAQVCSRPRHEVLEGSESDEEEWLGIIGWCVSLWKRQRQVNNTAETAPERAGLVGWFLNPFKRQREGQDAAQPALENHAPLSQHAQDFPSRARQVPGADNSTPEEQATTFQRFLGIFLRQHEVPSVPEPIPEAREALSISQRFLDLFSRHQAPVPVAPIATPPTTVPADDESLPPYEEGERPPAYDYDGLGLMERLEQGLINEFGRPEPRVDSNEGSPESFRRSEWLRSTVLVVDVDFDSEPDSAVDHEQRRGTTRASAFTEDLD